MENQAFNQQESNIQNQQLLKPNQSDQLPQPSKEVVPHQPRQSSQQHQTNLIDFLKKLKQKHQQRESQNQELQALTAAVQEIHQQQKLIQPIKQVQDQIQTSNQNNQTAATTQNSTLNSGNNSNCSSSNDVTHQQNLSQVIDQNHQQDLQADKSEQQSIVKPREDKSQSKIDKFFKASERKLQNSMPINDDKMFQFFRIMVECFQRFVGDRDLTQLFIQNQFSPQNQSHNFMINNQPLNQQGYTQFSNFNQFNNQPHFQMMPQQFSPLQSRTSQTYDDAFQADFVKHQINNNPGFVFETLKQSNNPQLFQCYQSIFNQQRDLSKIVKQEEMCPEITKQKNQLLKKNSIILNLKVQNVQSTNLLKQEAQQNKSNNIYVSQIKKPKNKFIIFKQDILPSVVAQYPNITHIQHWQKVSKQWKILAPERMAYYEELAQQDNTRYRSEVQEERDRVMKEQPGIKFLTKDQAAQMKKKIPDRNVNRNSMVKIKTQQKQEKSNSGVPFGHIVENSSLQSNQSAPLMKQEYFQDEPNQHIEVAQQLQKSTNSSQDSQSMLIKRKAKNSSNRPRLVSSYILYYNEKSNELKKTTQLDSLQILNVISNEWKGLSDEHKEYYKNLANIKNANNKRLCQEQSDKNVMGNKQRQ